MTPSPLDNLVKIGTLKAEPADPVELDGLIRSGNAKLVDALRTDLSVESRFELAYSAAFALALAALRWHGYRPENRYIVFQALTHTVGFPREKCRVLDDAHNKRNRSEYEGVADVDTKLLEGLTRIAGELRDAVAGLTPIGKKPAQ